MCVCVVWMDVLAQLEYSCSAKEKVEWLKLSLHLKENDFF